MKKKTPDDLSPELKKLVNSGINYDITILVLGIGIIIMLGFLLFK